MILAASFRLPKMKIKRHSIIYYFLGKNIIILLIEIF